MFGSTSSSWQQGDRCISKPCHFGWRPSYFAPPPETPTSFFVELPSVAGFPIRFVTNPLHAVAAPTSRTCLDLLQHPALSRSQLHQAAKARQHAHIRMCCCCFCGPGRLVEVLRCLSGTRKQQQQWRHRRRFRRLSPACLLVLHCCSHCSGMPCSQV